MGLWRLESWKSAGQRGRDDLMLLLKSKCNLEEEFPLPRWGQSFTLFFNCLKKRITYITEGNLHYSVYWFKCCGCACMLSLSVVLDSGTPWTVALQASLSMGFPMQEYFSKLTIPSWGDLSSPGTEPTTPAWQMDSLPLSDLGSSDLNVNLI